MDWSSSFIVHFFVTNTLFWSRYGAVHVRNPRNVRWFYTIACASNQIARVVLGSVLR